MLTFPRDSLCYSDPPPPRLLSLPPHDTQSKHRVVRHQQPRLAFKQHVAPIARRHNKPRNHSPKPPALHSPQYAHARITPRIHVPAMQIACLGFSTRVRPANYRFSKVWSKAHASNYVTLSYLSKCQTTSSAVHITYKFRPSPIEQERVLQTGSAVPKSPQIVFFFISILFLIYKVLSFDRRTHQAEWLRSGHPKGLRKLCGKKGVRSEVGKYWSLRTVWYGKFAVNILERRQNEEDWLEIEE